MFSTLAFAQAAAAAPKGPSLIEQLLPWALILVFVWYIMIRPQQKKARAHQEFVGQLKRGDQVLTAGGILGTIEGITERFVTLEVADGVRIRVLKNQISAPVKEEEKK